MINKPDIVSLKWVIGLMNTQCDKAEAALVEYGGDMSQKQPLLRCMWAVHQITSTLRALGMNKAEMLSVEMERSLNFLYKDKVQGERRKLAMGGVMQGLKVIPAYLEHTENIRQDTGRGLEQYVNDLRRWLGERPRPSALFFHMDIPEGAGVTADAVPAEGQEIKEKANVMLALYLEMAKQALRRKNVAESMKNVARIAKKMQTLFAGSEIEPFWFSMIGLCEGIAGRLITPDECIAQIFKTGAFAIKYARENGESLDGNVDYAAYTQQMLYYIASCKSKPVHISRVREAFGINDSTLSDASASLVHSDALIIALNGSLEHINQVIEFMEGTDLLAHSQLKPEDQDTAAIESVEAADCRLIAAGQYDQSKLLQDVGQKLGHFFGEGNAPDGAKAAAYIEEISNGLVSIKLDLEHKLEYGLNSNFSGTEFKLRESVATATFKQMSLVENYLHQILRRKALKNALDKKPNDAISLLNLTTALQRHLNKSEEGHEELRQLIRDADNGEANVDKLYEMALEYQSQLQVLSDREAIENSLELLQDISGALSFSGMEREGKVIEKCRSWLSAASDAGSVKEDEAFRCFADAFAQIEMHLQRSLIDPQDDTTHMVAFAEERAERLEQGMADLSPGRSLTAVPTTCEELEEREERLVQDADMPPEFRDVFLEESEEIVAELGDLTQAWLACPEAGEVLRDIRRHFHTFKGNGRAVGANVLGELGWAAQDMLDRSLDGELETDEKLQRLVNEVVTALPGLVESYANESGPDVDRIRQLTDACFAAAQGEDFDLESVVALTKPAVTAGQGEQPAPASTIEKAIELAPADSSPESDTLELDQTLVASAQDTSLSTPDEGLAMPATVDIGAMAAKTLTH